MLNCDPNFKIPFLTGEQLFKYWGENIFFAYLSKMCHLLPKKLMLVSGKPKILHTSKLHHAEKKTPELLFYLRPPTWSKWNLKYINIFWISSSSENIWCAYLRLVMCETHDYVLSFFLPVSTLGTSLLRKKTESHVMQLVNPSTNIYMSRCHLNFKQALRCASCKADKLTRY